MTTAEIDAAIELLAARHLLTRLPDGQIFRASPAEFRLVVEGLPGFATQVDPMGGQMVCKSRNVSRRRPAEDVARALGVPPGQEVLTIRCLWTVGGEPAAYSAATCHRSWKGWPGIAQRIIACRPGRGAPPPGLPGGLPATGSRGGPQPAAVRR